MNKTFRVQLTELELRTLRNLLAYQYHCDRRNVCYKKKRMAKGESDSRMYPIAEQEKHLKQKVRLLKKLARHLKDVKWFEQ